MNTVKNSSGRRERFYRPVCWPLQAVTWVVIATQILLPLHGLIGAETIRVSLPPDASTSANRTPQHPEPLLTPQTVTVNRTVPQATPPSGELRFSATPTDAEIIQARVFGEPLIPMGKTDISENRELAQALIAFKQRSDADDLETINNFLKNHPNSVWRVSLLTYLGIVHRHTGRFRRRSPAGRKPGRWGKM